MQKVMTLSATALALAAGLGGCSALRSTPVNFSDHGVRTGLQYALPRGLFYVQLSATGDDLSLSVSEPFYSGDPNASYMLEGASGALANQQYLLLVDPETRLLYHVNSRSEGQAPEIITNVVRGLAAVGTADGDMETSSDDGGSDDPQVIFRRVVDPFAGDDCNFGETCDFASLNEDLRQAALGYFNCASPATSKVGVCRRLTAPVHSGERPYLSLSLAPMFHANPGAAPIANLTANECRHAICYRAPAPYAISMRVAGVTDQSEMVYLPNEAPVMSLEAPAGVFATSHVRIEMMVDGMPARYTVDRENELVAITLLPFTLVREGFAAVGDVMKFRIDYNNGRVRQLDSERARENAEDRRRSDNRAAQGSFASESREGDNPAEHDDGGQETSASMTAPTADDTGERASSAGFAAGGAAAPRRAHAQTLLVSPLEPNQHIVAPGAAGGDAHDMDGGNG
ncbi:MAG: hypothetical protein ABL883_09420 [Terricaulis sp.]